MAETLDSTRLQPVAARERIESMDVLRGFALLGILLMNIEAFVGPMIPALTGLNPQLTGADRIADALIYIFVQGKFYTLFSLLFGMGFAVMSQRAEARQQPFAGIYLRRTLGLLVIGLIHTLLIWSGDILLTYALLAFVLLAFRGVSSKWLPWLAIGAYLLPMGFVTLFGVLGELASLSPQGAQEWNAQMATMASQMAAMEQGQRAAYGSGTYLQAVAQRAQDTGFMLSNIMMMGPLIFAMYLFGAWFVRSGAIAHPERFPRLYACLRWLALPIGLASMLASFVIHPTMEFDRMDMGTVFAFCASLLGSLLMAMGYLAWIVRALQSPTWARPLHWLAPAGRMALTNYLLQSIVCTLIFYGYGLGYFEQLSRAWQVPFVLAVFAVQVLLSRWWLARFRFGPAEWLWRTVTYLRPQPMRALAASH
ncbi:DUF418 domain-containing protein [Pseudoxanthomonas indica]|nr:DUF418 domain-containing protein [Pseudoxanthomonas indica]